MEFIYLLFPSWHHLPACRAVTKLWTILVENLLIHFSTAFYFDSRYWATAVLKYVVCKTGRQFASALAKTANKTDALLHF